jgi:hypothetical protein
VTKDIAAAERQPAVDGAVTTSATG